MVEFVQNYGLWIVLAGVFVAMHRFGMGCCGDRHRGLPQRDKALSGETTKGEAASETGSRAAGSRH